MSATRLPAEERRAALLDCACRAFADGTYKGTTTAEIAREAGVTEPILYRHFESKRDLYLSCLRESWRRMQARWEEVVAEQPDPRLWIAVMGRAFLESQVHRPVVSNLWIQALAESSEDPEIARYMRKHMREVHKYVTSVMQRAQAESALPPDRDPEAEAWIFLGLGLLSMADRAVGGVMNDQWPEIRRSRLRWLTGDAVDSL
ncbi:MAG: TetR/AcrR family transcriptional regulator [Gaiellaceae bacterium]|jgi:TetR/AcrR family transcriptional regulator